MPSDGPANLEVISSGRLEAFSDGVLAVIITITALELRAPDGSNFAALRHRLPEVLIYILSFTFLAIYWNNHHHLLRGARRISGAVMWANLLLLFWLSLMPVMTQWVGDFYDDSWPAASYGIVALCSALSFTLLVRMIIRAEGPDSTISAAIGGDRKGNTSVMLYVGAIGLAFVSPWISYALFAAVSVMWFIPDRRLVASVVKLRRRDQEIESSLR